MIEIMEQIAERFDMLLPDDFKMPKRISAEFIDIQMDAFGRLRKMWFSPFGLIDITDMGYHPVKRNWFDKLKNLIKLWL